jgi:hypothetical protein
MSGSRRGTRDYSALVNSTFTKRVPHDKAGCPCRVPRVPRVPLWSHSVTLCSRTADRHGTCRDSHVPSQA